MLEAVRATSLFVLLIAPGFLMVSGYSRRRFHRSPERDLYAVAQAVIASAIWLGVVWLFLLAVGDPLKDWGVVPFDSDELTSHRSDIVLVGLVVVVLPYALGALGAVMVDWLSIDRSELSGEESDPVFGMLKRLGVVRIAEWARLLEHPTAWDRAWSRYVARQGAGEVVVRMKDGLMIRGAYGKGAQADLSPFPPQLFLLEGYGYREAEDEERERVELGGYGREGIWVQVAEVEAIYFGTARGDDDGGPGGEGEAGEGGGDAGGQGGAGGGGGGRAGTQGTGDRN